jgi:hypothetical protein
VLNPKAWSDPADGQWGYGAAYYSDYRNRRQPDEQMSIRHLPPAREDDIPNSRRILQRLQPDCLPGLTGGNPVTTPTTSANG